ncbi:MAG TPA: FKBP-type peptidyl-prolyl cis-trans isomerase [Rhabdochlamydiaceae bacterium]|nr:FKBP-type peptidyl-prolyl cis-trans isomerase [Rhabdochlamydiaceae bacterium]
MKTNREKVSYCIGLETGKNLKNQFKDLDGTLLLEGFQDALQDRTPPLEREEIKNIMTALQQQVQKQQREFVMQVAQVNMKESETFLEENKKKEGVTTTLSGLQYKVISSGEGPTPTMMDEVTCHYRGSFINGTVFDSTYEHGKPQTFPLGRVIPGWSEALKMMKVGDKWQLFIPPYLAYGETGYGPQIQPNMTLIFEMELLGIN